MQNHKTEHLVAGQSAEMYHSRVQFPTKASCVSAISRYKQRQPGCGAHHHSWVNVTEGAP